MSAHSPACGDKECQRCPRIARSETCSPTCAGFYIDGADGVIRKCDACGLCGHDNAAGEHVDALLRAHAHDSMRDGWDLFDSSIRGIEVERDDEAGLLAYDDEAWPLAIAKLGKITGCNVGPR